MDAVSTVRKRNAKELKELSEMNIAFVVSLPYHCAAFVVRSTGFCVLLVGYM